MGRVFVKAEAMHAPQSLMFDRAGVPLITPRSSVPLKDTKGPLSSLGGGIGTALGTGLALTEQHRDFNSFLNSLIRQGVDFGRLGRGLGRGVDNLFAEKPEPLTPEQLELQRWAKLQGQAQDRLDRNILYEKLQRDRKEEEQTKNMQRNAVEASLPPTEPVKVGGDSFEKPPVSAPPLSGNLSTKTIQGTMPLQVGNSPVTTTGTAKVQRNVMPNVVAGAGAGAAAGAAVKPLKFAPGANAQLTNVESLANKTNANLLNQVMERDNPEYREEENPFPSGGPEIFR